MTFLSFESQMDKQGNTGSQEALFLHWNKETPTALDGMSAPSPAMIPGKKKTTRRAGSCEPCRKSKIKCDGRRPECTGCSKRKRSKCKDPCEYIPAKERSAAARRQHMLERSERRATSPLSAISEEDDESDDEDSSPNAFKFRGPPMSYGSDDFFGAFSLARSIDKFKSMCVGSAGVKLPDVAAQCNGIEAFDALPFPKPIEDHELLISKPQHSLSHYLPSTDLDLVPEIRDMGWKAINMKEKMIDEGRMHEAYKDFPGLAREARFFRGLNNNNKPKTKASSKSLQVQVEQKIYRLIVDMDIRICTHLGMQLEVQPDKIPQTTTFAATDADPWVSELEKSQSEFRQLAFEILSSLPSVSDEDEVTTSPRILEDLSLKWDQLRVLCSEDPAVPDTPKSKALFVEHLIDRRALSILLGCILGDQRSRSSDMQESTKPNGSTRRDRSRLDNGDDYTRAVLEAAQDILSLFASLGSLSDDCTWTCAYAVFCAAAITSIAILNGTHHQAKLINLKHAVDYFGRATRTRGKGYGLVAAPLTKMWTYVQAAMRPKAEKRRGNRHAEASSPTVKSETKHNKNTSPRGKRQHETTDDEVVEHSIKRPRRSPRVTRTSITPTALTFGQDVRYSHSHSQPIVLTHGYDGLGHVWQAGYDTSEPPSANTSFSSSVALDAPVTTAQEDFPSTASDAFEIHYSHYHPPHVDLQPPYYHGDPRIPKPHYNNARFYRYKDPEYLADTSPGRPMISAPQGPINPQLWQMANHANGMADPMYSNMPPQESRRGSVISQHDYNTSTHQVWPEHSAGLNSGTHLQQMHPGYSTGEYFDNNVTPVMTNAANWMNPERYPYEEEAKYPYEEEATEDESTWQLEQAHGIGQQPLSLGCGL